MRKLDPQAVQHFLNNPDAPETEKERLRALVHRQREMLESNPLLGFWPHPCRHCGRYASPSCPEHGTPQLDFLKAVTRIAAAFAGNRFGKTTALIVWILCQHAPLEMLPLHLRSVKRTGPKRPAMGRMLCPSEDALIEYVIPALKKWCPKELLRGGSWEKAWSKQHSILFFREGCGQLSVYTYKQDPAVMVGAELDYVAYDEPPPEEHRKECLVRLIDRNGFERFALTPVNMVGGGIGWLYRKIWKRRDDPHITVVRGSSYENRTLPREAIDAVLSEYDEKERAARERGEFIHMGGMVYDNGFEGCLVPRPTVEHVLGLEEHIVGIDPGLRNAAFVWEGFDRDNTCLVFDEALLQNRTPADYQLTIALTNARWGLGDKDERDVALGTARDLYMRGLLDRDEWEQHSQLLTGPTGPRPLYVIDPSARNRSLVDAESVESELARLGIYCVHGQNNVEAGCQQIRRRIQFGKFLVSRECTGLRGEAEEYRQENRDDGVFKVVKENDHRLDACRYPAMHRPVRREEIEEQGPRQRPMDQAWPPPVRVEESGPLGSFV